MSCVQACDVTSLAASNTFRNRKPGGCHLQPLKPKLDFRKHIYVIVGATLRLDGLKDSRIRDPGLDPLRGYSSPCLTTFLPIFVGKLLLCCFRRDETSTNIPIPNENHCEHVPFLSGQHSCFPPFSLPHSNNSALCNLAGVTSLQSSCSRNLAAYESCAMQLGEIYFHTMFRLLSENVSWRPPCHTEE